MTSVKSRKRQWIEKELAGADRGILIAIALEQIALSVLVLYIAAMFPSGSRGNLLRLYALAGPISAFALFFNGPLPRIISMLWHAASPYVRLLAVAIARGTLRADSTPTSVYLWWGFFDVVAALYLATTAVIQYRKRRSTRQNL
ncbi:MAG TPA: hypothetical protein VI488_08470 [Candidatus Angelobacter sp.]